MDVRTYDDFGFGFRQPSAMADVTLKPDPARPANPDQPTANGLAGDNYAFLTNVDPAGGSITFNAVAWFTGGAAVQACTDDGVEIHDSAWCNDYYYRDRNDLLRIMQVEPGAGIQVLDSDGVLRNGTLADVAAAGPDAPFRLTIAQNQITAVRQVFIP